MLRCGTAHVMIKVWANSGKIKYEEQFCTVLCSPQLILELPSGYRTNQDWLDEVISEIDLAELILPEKFEICAEPLLYECIGELIVTGSHDYLGEYDEEYEFELEKWTCDFCAEETELNLFPKNFIRTG